MLTRAINRGVLQGTLWVVIIKLFLLPRRCTWDKSHRWLVPLWTCNSRETFLPFWTLLRCKEFQTDSSLRSLNILAIQESELLPWTPLKDWSEDKKSRTLVLQFNNVRCPHYYPSRSWDPWTYHERHRRAHRWERTPHLQEVVPHPQRCSLIHRSRIRSWNLDHRYQGRRFVGSLRQRRKDRYYSP